MAFPIKNFRSIPLYIYERLKIHDPQSKYSAFILEEFRIMSHFEYRLNRRFWRSKKVVQMGEVNWTKSKRTATFFRKTFPKSNHFSVNFISLTFKYQTNGIAYHMR